MTAAPIETILKALIGCSLLSVIEVQLDVVIVQEAFKNNDTNFNPSEV